MAFFNYFIAIKIAKTKKMKRKRERIVVLIGLIQGLGTLFFFISIFYYFNRKMPSRQ
jgi:hypothetical protein